MPISDIWTLEPAGSPGSAQTLAARGVSSATLSRQSQAAAVLSLTWERGDGLTCDFADFAWESQWVLRRSGTIVFRGRVATPAGRSGNAGGESVSIELRDAWWDLERTIYVQEWSHATATTLATTQTSRARLCWDGATTRQTTAEAMAVVIAAATAAGTEVSLDVSEMPALTPPPIEGVNRMCSQLILDLLRWHPECSAWIESDAEGDTLVVRNRSTAAVRTIAIGGTGTTLESVDLATRDDLVVDSVHVIYESEIARSASIPGEAEGDPATIRVRPRLAVHKDVYPALSTITRRSMVITIPYQSPSGSGSQPPTPPQPHRVPIKTRPLPPTGSYNTEAEKFWLKALGLSALGLGADDIKLPTSTVGRTKVHTVSFAHPEDDPDDPLYDVPDPVNPESTVVWRPPSEADLPRYLVHGQLAGWMNVEAAELNCTATVAVKKATVDALPDRERALFHKKNPRVGTVSGVPAYLVDGSARVMGTTAKTQIYKNYPAQGSGDVAADNSGAHAASLEEVVIPGLAQTLYTARATAPHEGRITLTAAEAGAVSYLGAVVRLSHAERPEWSSMRALVQGESLRIDSGMTTVTFGPAEHLSVQDFIALHEAARPRRGEGGGSMPTQPTTGEESAEQDDPDHDGGIYPGTVGPVLVSDSTGLEDGLRQWTIRVVDEGAGPVAQIRSGTLTGLGLSGYLGTWVADAWNTITMDRNVWLKLTFSVEGLAHTYYSAPGDVETVYIPAAVVDASAELHYTTLGAADPTHTDPTINPTTGAPVTDGVYYFRIGSSSSSAPANDYLGPLLCGWCPPESPWVVQAT